MKTNKRGIKLLQDPSLNKSTAFTEAEKQALGLVGLLPDVTETEDLQLSRVLMQLGHKTSDLDRYIYTCECGLISGSVKYDPEPLDAPAAGNLLICVSRPQEDTVIDL